MPVKDEMTEIPGVTFRLNIFALRALNKNIKKRGKVAMSGLTKETVASVLVENNQPCEMWEIKYCDAIPLPLLASSRGSDLPSEICPTRTRGSRLSLKYRLLSLEVFLYP